MGRGSGGTQGEREGTEVRTGRGREGTEGNTVAPQADNSHQSSISSTVVSNG